MLGVPRFMYAGITYTCIIFKLYPQAPCPFIRYWRCVSVGKYHLVNADCPLSEIQRLFALWEQMY